MPTASDINIPARYLNSSFNTGETQALLQFTEVLVEEIFKVIGSAGGDLSGLEAAVAANTAAIAANTDAIAANASAIAANTAAIAALDARVVVLETPPI